MASKFVQPPAFTATGKGYFNKLPNFPATAQNANGIFVNLGRTVGDSNHTMYTFITSVVTGWQVAGSYGQSPAARTWYPTNLSQSEMAITGIVANQYEYDRLVEFIHVHHNTAIDRKETDQFIGTKSIDFKLKPFRIPIGTQQGTTEYYVVHQGMHFKGYITNITAGHQRFVNAPTWTLTFRISDDMLQQPVHLQGELNRELYKNYLGLFGTFYKGPKNLGAQPVPPSNGDGFSATTPDFWRNITGGA